LRLNDEYIDRRQIARELRTVNEHIRKYGWRTVDVSYKAIEEIAREILQLLKESGIDVKVRDQAGQ